LQEHHTGILWHDKDVIEQKLPNIGDAHAVPVQRQ
jgi:hypothetical protein